MKTSGAVLAVFTLLTLAFLFLTIGKFGGNANMTKVGGWVGLATALVAWYASFAAVTNSTWKRIVLPTWPLS